MVVGHDTSQTLVPMGHGYIHIYNTKNFKGHTNTSAKERERSRVFVCPFLLLSLFLLLFSLVVSLCSATWRTQFTYLVCLKAFLCSDRQGKHLSCTLGPMAQGHRVAKYRANGRPKTTRVQRVLCGQPHQAHPSQRKEVYTCRNIA